jgi:hypothetical protein
MNRSAATTCSLIVATVMLSAIGCGESRAPAMTSPAQASVEPQYEAASSGESGLSIQPPSSDAADGKVDEPQTTPPTVASSPPVQAERTRDISFDDLKFDINKGDPFQKSMLTEKIEALDAKPVRIRGFILPSFLQTGLTQFVLVRDNMACCFGPGAALYDCVIVEMKPGKSTDYSLYPVAVEGTFAIREMLDADGKAVAVYHLDGQSVR